MSKFEQHIVSMRFLEVLDDLIKRKVVANQSDFCKQIDYDVQSLSQIRVKKRNVTIDLISKLFDTFKGNPIYLLTGRGHKILSESALEQVQEPSAQYGKLDKSPSIKTLEELVRSKDDVIELLKKEVARLETEVGKKKQKK